MLRKTFAPKSVIREIHYSFDSAGEKLLQEALAIIQQPEDSEGEILLKNGFSNAAPVKKAAERADAKEMIKKIEHYRQNYPVNKFITEEMVEAICNKYGLVCAKAGMYKGEFPSKNIAELAAFKFHRQDLRRAPERFLIAFSWDGPEKPDFVICAPVKDLNTYGMSRIGIHLFSDPIVLCPVKGGYLIVTKWGLEAGDELVRNDIDN